MKHYLVVTPQYEVYGQTEIEPAEYGADAIEVEASNKRDAILKGVKTMLASTTSEYGRIMYQWCKQQRSEGVNPFSGVKAFEQTPSEVED